MKRLFAVALLGLAGMAQAQANFGWSTSGSITTQNLVPTGAATTGSCVVLDITNKGTIAAQVSGTYTGALSAQRTADGAIWETLSASSTFTNVAGTATATVSSGTTGTFALGNVAGFRAVRVCGLAAVTGTATVVIYTSPAGGASGGGGAAGAVTVSDGSDAALGTTTDAAATAGGTGTVSAKLRRISTQIPAALGSAVMAAAMPVTIATDDTIIASLATKLDTLNTTYSVTTVTLANVSASASSVTCLASNASRKGAIFVNESNTATTYFKYGATASATSYTFSLSPGGTLILPAYPIYTGIIDCISTVASGTIRVTEE